ncbi:MAG: ABC transporter permease [Deltaproteobacteria bacterium]|jgi:putative ABC transport system permease protein|nr:ABC transporter permease [Deltaproteobacteria bacterium]
MFFKMLLGALSRQKRKHLMIAFTVGLGVSLATAMLGVMFDVGDKVNQELKSYGANLSVIPKGASILSDLYRFQDEGQTNGESGSAGTSRAGSPIGANDPSGSSASSSSSSSAGSNQAGAADVANNFIPESELYKIKMIFWAYNIVDFAPYLSIDGFVGETSVPLTGTWFNKHLSLPTGDEVDTGMTGLKSWWVLDGPPGDDSEPNEVLVGKEAAQKLNLTKGSQFTISLKPGGEGMTFTVKTIFESGGEDDGKIFASLAPVQELADRKGLVQRVEVSALTTPENELARRAAQNPGSLTRLEWDTWYCTAYISSIAYQIEEILPMVRVKAILRVAQSEGAILEKTQLMIILLTVLTLICSALAISNLVTANVMERSVEIGLMKALGATGLGISVLVLSEILIASFVGGLAGYLVGLALSQLIGLSVFGSHVAIKLVVIPIGVLMVLLVSLLGSLPALRALLRLKPTEVLHGR